MTKVLITHSYFLRFDPKQWKLQQPYPPLGTLYAASILMDAGHEVHFFDTMFAESPQDLQNALDTIQPNQLVIYDDGFNYLTKMCLTNMRDAAFEMIKIGKLAGCKVIVSSSDATDHAVEYLKKGADFIMKGEGEQTLQELVAHLSNQKEEPVLIKGLSYLQDGNLVETDSRPVSTQLDDLPHPAWELVDWEQYRKTWMKSSGYFSVNYATTRGCPYKCNWCAKPIYGNRYNSHSPKRVVEDLQRLKQFSGFSHIWFCDDIFGLKPGWVQDFSKDIKKAGLSFKFKIQSRVDLLLQDDTIEALKSAGCEEVWVGAESGSQTILDAMDKGTTVEQIYEATQKMKAIDLKPCFFLQFGYIGETEKNIQQTIKMVLDLMPHNIGISVSYPLPGTPFYDRVKHELSQKSNWTDSDELALMFHNTYPPEYYKILQKYVHKLFRSKEARQAAGHLFRGKMSAANLKKLGLWPYYSLMAAKNRKTLGSLARKNHD